MGILTRGLASPMAPSISLIDAWLIFWLMAEVGA
jgi:hypothetical protein